MKHQKLDFFFFHQTSIHHHHHHHHHYRHHHYRSSIFIIICSPFRATFRVARKPKSLLSSRRHRIPEKRASASRESAIYHSSSFVPCSSAGSMYLLVSACSFFCRSSTDAILHKLSDLPKRALFSKRRQCPTHYKNHVSLHLRMPIPSGLFVEFTAGHFSFF